MIKLLKLVSLGLFLTALAAPPVMHEGIAQQRAYAPENLRTLSPADQSRVISMEYSEQSRGRRIPDDQLRFYLDQVNRSNWGFSQIKQDIAQSLGDNNGGRRPPPAPNPNNIRCESTDGRQRTCPTPWTGQSRLVRQISGTRCVEGQNWSSSPGRVWVNGGCRAEFTEGNPGWPGADENYSVTCASHGSRHTTCAWDRKQGRPYLLQQMSRTDCIERQTWGYDRSQGLWVSGGFRARFGTRR